MKKLILLCIGFLILGACTLMKADKAVNKSYLLVGSYNTIHDEGIKVYLWDSEMGEANYVDGVKGISNPSYQVVSADGKRIYSVGEDEGETSTVHALSFDKVNGELKLMNTQLTQGGAPCYVNISPDGPSCPWQLLNPLSVSLDLSISGISYHWNPTICGLYVCFFHLA